MSAFLKKRSFTFQHLVAAQPYCDQFTSGYPINIFVNRASVIQTSLAGTPMVYDPVTKHTSEIVDTKEFYAALKQIN